MGWKVNNILSTLHDIDPDNTPYNIKATYFGWIHMYAVFITFGIIVSIFAAYICMKRKRVPPDSLIWSAFLIIPMALLGASFLGKLNSDPSHPWTPIDGTVPFWSLFAFWKGGMSIHGGVLFGIIGGFIVFPVISKKTHVSLWVYADCIIPNIILGQVIGRWGNFFNHELLGEQTTLEQLSWLPNFIRYNCFSWQDVSNGVVMHYRQPLFLYESFFNFVVWVVVMFIVPNMFKIFSPKPWKKYPTHYQFSWKYTFARYFRLIAKDNHQQTWNEVWNDAFYSYHPTKEILDKNISASKYRNSKRLLKLNNPHRYWITFCGVQTGFYFFGWNLVRFILETKRTSDSDLFIINNRPADYAVLITLFVFGLLLAAYAQVIAPRYLRKNGHLYEKEYIDYTNLLSWDFKSYFKNNKLIIGKNNFANTLPQYIKNSVMEYLGYPEKEFDKWFEIKDFKTENSKDLTLEIVAFSFIIKAKKEIKEFYDEYFVSFNTKYNLNKSLNKLKITLPNQKDFLTKKEFITICQNYFLINKNKIKIVQFWENNFVNIDWKQTNILDLDWDKLILFDKIKLANKKLFVISKFNLGETNSYYFKHKVKIKKITLEK